MAAEGRLRIGVSACLLGEPVRFDGGHKRDVFLVEILGRYVHWVAVCPEAEMGLGTPREALRLVSTTQGVRLVVPRSGIDHTDGMLAWSARRVSELAAEDLDGYVFKKDSPTCGIAKVRVYDSNGAPARSGTGLFAAAFLAQFPHLPAEEEGRLHDPRIRENFVGHAFAHRRWKEMRAGDAGRAALMEFHQHHKYALMARSPNGAAELGRLLGSAARGDNARLAEAYHRRFSEIMRRVPTLRGHANVLQHLAGYVTDRLDRDDREELTRIIRQYRHAEVPLIVPVTLLRHYARKFGEKYLAGQVYLNPHPGELALLNQL